MINLNSTKFPGESARGQCVNCSNCHDAGKDDILVRNLTLNTTEEIPGPHAPARIGIRTIPRSSKEEFKIELTTLATKKLYGDFSCTPTIRHPFLTMKTIEEVLKRLHYIDSEEDLVDLVNDRDTRLQVLSLIQDFFRDIPIKYCYRKLLHDANCDQKLSDLSEDDFLNLDSELDNDKDEYEGHELEEMSFLQ